MVSRLLILLFHAFRHCYLALFLSLPFFFLSRVEAVETRVAINEVHYHPGDDTMDGEFIELCNYGPEEADLSGWQLTGGVRMTFQQGVVLPAGSCIVVARNSDLILNRYELASEVVPGTYLGALENNGELLQLRTSEGYLVSSVDYGDSDPWPEAPDGLGPSLERISPLFEDDDPQAWAASVVVGGTPGRRNSVHPAEADTLVRPSRDVVINELFMDGASTGWVELYNRSGTDVDASQWRIMLYPPILGESALPVGTVIAAGGFLVFNEADLGFDFENGHASILATADGRLVDAINPRTAPAGFSTGRIPDGSDNRRVFSELTPGAANALEAPPDVVINEIMFHPADGNTGGEYFELHNPTEAAIDLSGWSMTRGVEYTFPSPTLLEAGGYLVVAEDPEAAESYYDISTNAPEATLLGPYTGSLRNDAETLLLRDALRNPVDRVRFADEGSWPESTDGTGPSVELIHAQLENRFGPAWRASEGEGTPGAPNSRHQSDPLPIVAGVSHSPVIPSSQDSVTVLAAVSDDQAVEAAWLLYDIDGSGGGPSQVAMADDGLKDDGVAGNGVYGGIIPPQPDTTVVAFWFEAEASGGQMVTVPDDVPGQAYLYRVEDTTTEVSEEDRPLYRLVMLADDLDELRTRDPHSNELLNLTFVAHGKAYYRRRIRHRGSGARKCDPLSYRVQFDHDTDFHGIKRLNLNACHAEKQWIGLDFLRRTGIPTPQFWLRRLSFNGDVESSLHLRVEAIEKPFIERNFPGDDGGNLYRGLDEANLDYRGDDFDPYREHYIKKTNELADDFSDIVDLCARFDRDITSNGEFPAAIEEVIDTDQWSLYFAAFALLGSTEGGFLRERGDDYFLYRRPSDGRWVLLPWDLDSVFNEADQILFRPELDAVRRYLRNRRYAPDYWCHLQELHAAAFPVDQTLTRIDHLSGLFSGGDLDDLRDYAPERFAYIAERIEPAIEVHVDDGGSTCPGFLFFSKSNVDLSGEAPGCGTSEVLINGVLADYSATSNDWSASVDVDELTTLEIVTHYRDGTETNRLDLEIQPTGGTTALASDIDGSLTLTRGGSPYRATGDVLVRQGATVTVEPGVEVQFDFDSTLRVDGTLIAEGNENEPIVFENSYCDDSWGGVVFLPGSTDSRLVHCTLRQLTGVDEYRAGFVVDGAEVSVSEVAVEPPSALVLNDGFVQASDLTWHGGEQGFRFEGGGGVVEDSQFEGFSGAAIYATGSSAAPLTIEDTVFSGCGVGVQLEGASLATLRHLTIYGCETGLELKENGSQPGGGGVDADSLIIWESAQAVSMDPSADLELAFSCTDGGVLEGTGNISSDPLMVDPPSGDYRIRYHSPCRGTGKEASDMGAIPYVSLNELSQFQRCDANGDGMTDISDAVFSLFALFVGTSTPPCFAALDCNSDGFANLTDAIFQLAYIFLEGSPPSPPFPACDEALVEECFTTTCP